MSGTFSHHAKDPQLALPVLLGWVGPSWTGVDVAVALGLASASLLAAGAARRAPLPSRVVPLVAAGGALALLPTGPVTTSVACLIASLPALGVLLRCARLPRRARRPWAHAGAILLLSGWLGSSGLPWLALALVLAGAEVWVGTPLVRSRAHAWPAFTLDLVLVSIVLASAQRSVMLPRNLVTWVPIYGAWLDGVAVAAVLLLIVHLSLDWRRQLRGLLGAGLAGAAIWIWWPDAPRPGPSLEQVWWTRFPVVTAATGGTLSAHDIDRWRPVYSVATSIPTHDRQIWVRVGFPIAPLTTAIGTAFLVPDNPAIPAAMRAHHRSAPSTGTVQQAFDTCQQMYCNIRVDPSLWKLHNPRTKR